MAVNKAAPSDESESAAPARHQTARETISYGSGFGFLAGMFLPPGMMFLGVDLHLENLPLVLAVAIFVGSPLVGWLLLWWLFTVGVESFGRPAMAYVNTVLFMITFAVVGWFAGYAMSGWSVIGGVVGAVGLALPNFFLFHSKREYLYGEDGAMTNDSGSPE